MQYLRVYTDTGQGIEVMNRFSDKLARLLQPRTIAVIGGHFAQAVARQCDKMGYTR